MEQRDSNSKRWTIIRTSSGAFSGGNTVQLLLTKIL
jgi:hypothetical protein